MNVHLRCLRLRLGLLLLPLLLLGFISMGCCQVVAPTWLQQHSRRPTLQAAPVKVTPLNLMETAAIRAQIQKAVNDGTYVVAASPQQFASMLGQANPANGGQPLAQMRPIWPAAFRMPNATMWWG